MKRPAAPIESSADLNLSTWKSKALQSIPAAAHDFWNLQLDRWLMHALQLSREALWLQGREPLTPLQRKQLQEVEAAWREEVPLAYLEKSCGFWGLELEISKAVLIPRPDSEVLVQLVQQHAAPGQRLLEWGIGSGALSLALGTLEQKLEILGLEKSPEALAIARRNRQRHFPNSSRIRFEYGDWWTSWALWEQQAWDWVLANPPYVTDKSYQASRALQHEPSEALVAPKQGFADLFQIAEMAREALKPGGFLLMEHGENQQPMLMQRLKVLGYQGIQACQDAGNRPRGVLARWPGGTAEDGRTLKVESSDVQRKKGLPKWQRPPEHNGSNRKRN